jgi:hypothetical protein
VRAVCPSLALATCLTVATNTAGRGAVLPCVASVAWVAVITIITRVVDTHRSTCARTPIELWTGQMRGREETDREQIESMNSFILAKLISPNALTVRVTVLHGQSLDEKYFTSSP